MTHTPGLWEVSDYYRFSVNQSSESEKHKHIAMVNFYNCADPEIRVSFEESKANAVLIAAAPDLLDALEELVDLVEAVREGEYEIGYYTTQPAKQIIAKARGRPPKEKG